MGRAILLTGPPGVGKTTVVRLIVAGLGERAGGFYTEEIREGMRRVGFRIVTLDGQIATLAHVHSQSPYRVGRYGVEVGELNRIGVAAIHKAIAEREVVVVDEIGKMELFSVAFRDAVLAALASPKMVLGTITQAAHPWASALRQRPEVELVTVTPANRDALPEKVLASLLGQG